MTTSTPRQRGAALGAVAVAAAGVLCAVLLPTWAAPGELVAADPMPGTEEGAPFRTVGDGSLPEAAPPLRGPHEPLSSAERGYAFRLAREALPDTARDVRREPGGELISADLPALADRTAARLVVVTAYDYATDELHQLLLDLGAGEVVSDQHASGLQLPPTEAETAIALELAITAEPAPTFVVEYRELNNAPLLTADQVSAVAGVWRPAAEALAAPVTDVCGRHRCVQLLVALPTGEYLDTHDIVVDLSARAVLPAEQEDHRHED